MRNRLAVVTMLVALLLSLTVVTTAQLSPQNKFQQAVDLLETKGDVRAAMKLFEETAKSADRSVAARSLFYLGACREKLGDAEAGEARKAYERVVRDFGDQSETVAQARLRLAAMGGAADPGAVRERQLEWDDGMPAADGRTVLRASAIRLAVRDLVSGQERIVAKGNQKEGLYFDGGLISPDGKKVVYILLSNKERSRQIRVVGTDGSKDRPLSDQTYEHGAGGTTSARVDDWSPDSRQVLAWVHRKDQKDSQRILLSVDDGSARVLSTFVGGDSRSYGYGEPGPRARFSPDGRHVAYEIERASEQPKRIFTVPVQGGEPQLLIDHPSHTELVGWTPEGRLVFLSDRSGTRALWTLRIRDGKADGEPELVRRDIGSSAPEGIDRNGAYYFRLVTENREVYRATLDPSSGAVVSGPSSVSSRYVGRSFSPAYSRDGRFLAYFSGPFGSYDIHIRNLTTGEERELKSPMSYTFWQSLAWYPDGSALLIRGMRVGDTVIGLHRLDLTTGAITTLALAKGGGAYSGWDSDPSFSPDGKYIYFQTYESDLAGVAASRISRLDLQTGSQEHVFLPALPAQLGDFALSPDGTRFVFWAIKSKPDYIGIVPVGGGKSTAIYEYPASEGGRNGWGPNWTADGKGVIFQRLNSNDDYKNDDLWLVSSEGGSLRKLLSATGFIISHAVHPNGREIAFSTDVETREFRVVENLFPRARAAK